MTQRIQNLLCLTAHVAASSLTGAEHLLITDILAASPPLVQPPCSRNHVGPTRKSRGPPGEITWAPRGNHVGTQGKSRGPHPEITWAPRGNHVGPQGKSRGHPGEITWAPRGNHVGPSGKSRGPPGEITWAQSMGWMASPWGAFSVSVTAPGP